MSHEKKHLTPFHLQGWLVGFGIEEGYKVKRLRLATGQQEWTVKLAKSARLNLDPRINPGVWVEVWGDREFSPKRGEIKFKAYDVKLGNPAYQETLTLAPDFRQDPPNIQPQTPNSKPQTILVCQKSDCWKHGGKEVCQAMERELRDRGLDQSVTIKTTGCMKRCKQAPNLVMPDKTRYSQVEAKDVPHLCDKHLAATPALVKT